MKNTHSAFFPLGFSSIVTILITIFFFTFAALSLATAYSDYSQSKKIAKQTTSYYAADSAAREMAAHIDGLLYDIYLHSSSAKDFYQMIETTDFTKNIPDKISSVSMEVQNDYTVISYLVPVSEEQQLSVSLKINYPLHESECFSTITSWQTLNIKTQTSERTLSQ